MSDCTRQQGLLAGLLPPRSSRFYNPASIGGRLSRCELTRLKDILGASDSYLR